ncbi:sorbitol dehydrogenase [Hyalella azteca]|uniref:Sorbitol dehydrogenase n=1 Tax=Hyalella azteca TaxID=294128 RepID=A0A8B7NNG6_HYAAZ|nr:sorbitol dehydrogenase [Hyalella azteca]
MADCDNLSAVLHRALDLRLEQRPIPEPGPGEVLLRVLCVGICGSDVHYWNHGRTARFVVESPLVLGHETAAQVVRCGPDVSHLQPGTVVALEPGVPCRRCSLCRGGRYNLCPRMRFHATPPVDGTLTRYFVHPADFCFRLPDHMSAEDGALLEPLAVAVHSCRRARVGPQSRVLVTGAGPIGQVSVLVAKAMGATHICITDINEGRLQFARKLGADSAVCVAGMGVEEAAAAVVAAGGPPTAALECSGADSSLVTAIHAADAGCVIATVGRGSLEPLLPVPLLTAKEVEICGIFRYANCYPAALALLASGAVNARQLISHRFTLEEVEEAFQAAKSGVAIKVMIKVGEKS